MLHVKNLQKHFSGRSPLIHIVLDGWGVGEQNSTNAIYLANTPLLIDF
jgi:Phosphoglyceromutase